MTCKTCRKKLVEDEARCPHCGAANPDISGVFQTSVVLISTGGADLVYRSVDEVPVQLRNRLIKSTNGANSATILIADRRGRKEAAKAMRRSAMPGQRKLTQTLLESGVVRWLTPSRRKAIGIGIAILTVALIALVFGYRWV